MLRQLLNSGAVRAICAAGPADNPASLQLLQLLCSLLKLCNSSAVADGSWDDTDTASARSNAHVCWIADTMFEQSGIAAAAGAVGSSSSSSRASSSDGGSASSSSIGGASTAARAVGGTGDIVSTVLPWVVLRGRCCLYGVVKTEHDRASLPSHPVCQLGAARAWLSAAAEPLARMGYDMSAVLGQLQAAQAAVAAAVAAEAELGTDTPFAQQGCEAALTVLAQQLQAAGVVLTGFAIAQVCNNPGCSNQSGPSEAALVGDRSCLCSGCRVARYCSRAPCQRQHWKSHKHICKALAAAAAAATAEGTAGGAS